RASERRFWIFNCRFWIGRQLVELMNPVSKSQNRESAPTEISSEPLINAVHVRLPALLFAGSGIAIIYVCLIPFDVTRDVSRLPRRQFLGLGLEHGSVPDILANIAYYLPIAIFGYGMARRRGFRRFAAAALVLAGAAALSFSIEYAQR